MGYFADHRADFVLLGAHWRGPQLGALGALIAHLSLDRSEPALISLPTGAGKTAIALSAAFLVEPPPARVLVLVPSRAVREQMVEQFGSLKVLRRIGAWPAGDGGAGPRVFEVTGTTTDWSNMGAIDVVVAIPQSISPASEGVASVPPADLFDLVIVDEAHHLPAATWRAVLDHIEPAATVLLTATPFRLDRKPVPGFRIFHYPLRQAIASGFYKPIRAIILPLVNVDDLDAKDAKIRDETVALLAQPEHQSSAFLVRAHSIARAKALAQLYEVGGVGVEVLTSRTSPQHQDDIIARLTEGGLRGVAVVGMLGEGFDLPRLRVVAYHDKHKSMPATVQLIGRLARVSSEFPQESVLVTVDDAEVYPELRGVVRELYREDADWSIILPGLVDAEVIADQASTAFLETIEDRGSDLKPGDLYPMPGPLIFEVSQPAWTLQDGFLPNVAIGDDLAGASVVAIFAMAGDSAVAIVTRRRSVPPWTTDNSLESIEYELSIISHRPAPTTTVPSLVFLDISDGRMLREVHERLALPPGTRPVNPERLDLYLQSLPRVSVSSVGMRNILASTSGTTYKTRAGRSTDRDLLTAEATQTSLGHVMMQIVTPAGSTTVGAAFEKGKIWQRRYRPMVEYDTWITQTAQLLWFPTSASIEGLLPQVSRGRALIEWPTADPIAVEMNPSLAGGGWQVFDSAGVIIGPLEDFQLHAGSDPTETLTMPPRTTTTLPVVAVFDDRQADSHTTRWAGILDVTGAVTTVGADLLIRRGHYGDAINFGDFLREHPPLIYFLDGHATHGHELFDVIGGSSPQYDYRDVLEHDWIADGVDLTAETRKKATAHATGISIHEALEGYLTALTKQERYRWILCNDGSGEIADYVVVEYTPGRPVRLGLWHAKATSGQPGLRVEDFQVVVAQALRSRARFNDPKLWKTIRDRLCEREAPHATVVNGSDSPKRLLVLLGEQRNLGVRRTHSWERTRPLVQGEIAIVQPGLSRLSLIAAPGGVRDPTAESLRQLFGVFADTVAVTGGRGVVLGSP
jgi:superfamily II DNA or RNA helicase